MAGPVCGTSGACREPSVQVSGWLVAAALSDRCQAGRGTRGPTGEIRLVNRMNSLDDVCVCAVSVYASAHWLLPCAV